MSNVFYKLNISALIGNNFDCEDYTWSQKSAEQKSASYIQIVSACLHTAYSSKMDVHN